MLMHHRQGPSLFISHSSDADKQQHVVSQPARGTRLDRRIRRSRVTRGRRCTMLVAPMISSAGSLSKSRVWIVRQMSSVKGQVWILARVRVSSGESRSISMRFNSVSLAISQRTIAEILHESIDSNEFSRGVKSSVKA